MAPGDGVLADVVSSTYVLERQPSVRVAVFHRHLVPVLFRFCNWSSLEPAYVFNK